LSGCIGLGMDKRRGPAGERAPPTFTYVQAHGPQRGPPPPPPPAPNLGLFGKWSRLLLDVVWKILQPSFLEHLDAKVWGRKIVFLGFVFAIDKKNVCEPKRVVLGKKSQPERAGGTVFPCDRKNPYLKDAVLPKILKNPSGFWWVADCPAGFLSLCRSVFGPRPPPPPPARPPACGPPAF